MLEEAKNERMHLMFFLEIAQPNKFERFLITAAQFIFWHFYLVLYIISYKTAHRMVAYFEEEAVNSYTEYLNLVESGQVEDVCCPSSARNYYGLGPEATLSTMIRYVRADEQRHADANMRMSL
jgi:ubiquinol oxidase